MQADLWTEAPAQRHSATSRDAATEIEPHAGTLRAHVLAYVEKHGPCTDEQISTGLGMNPSTARPRRVEPERAGLIVKAGTAKTSSGRSAVTWAISPGGA
jgi:predicted ArsR family transcriptional regulator